MYGVGHQYQVHLKLTFKSSENRAVHAPALLSFPKASRFLVAAGDDGASVRSISAVARLHGEPASTLPLVLGCSWTSYQAKHYCCQC